MRRMAWLTVLILFVQIAIGQVPALAQTASVARPHALSLPSSASRPVVRTGPAAPSSALSPPSTAFGFGYDDQGRLIEASDPAGSTAAYQWDKAGNLLSVARSSSSAVSVTQLAPASAPVGATVRVYGTGFSIGAGKARTPLYDHSRQGRKNRSL